MINVTMSTVAVNVMITISGWNSGMGGVGEGLCDGAEEGQSERDGFGVANDVGVGVGVGVGVDFFFVLCSTNCCIFCEETSFS